MDGGGGWVARAPANIGIPDYDPLALLSSPLQIASLLLLKRHFLEEDGAGATIGGSSVFTEEVGSARSCCWWQFPSAHFYLRDKPLAPLFIVSHEISYHFRAPLSSFQMPLTHFA